MKMRDRGRCGCVFYLLLTLHEHDGRGAGTGCCEWVWADNGCVCQEFDLSHGGVYEEIVGEFACAVPIQPFV